MSCDQASLSLNLLYHNPLSRTDRDEKKGKVERTSLCEFGLILPRFFAFEF
jgi:hypothetical protein